MGITMEFIFGVIIMIIAYLSNRSKLSKENEEKPVIDFPPQKSEPPSIDKHFEQEQAQVKVKTIVKQAEEVKENVLEDLQADLLETKKASEEKMRELQEKEQLVSQRIEAIKKQVDEKQKYRDIGLTFKEDDIVKGIILSEVLGPPRAKKSYERI